MRDTYWNGFFSDCAKDAATVASTQSVNLCLAAGRMHDRIPFGHTAQRERPAAAKRHAALEPSTAETPSRRISRCDACQATLGQYHIPGCPRERCPACGRQACPCEVSMLRIVLKGEPEHSLSTAEWRQLVLPPPQR
jgi:hypothetical protein